MKMSAGEFEMHVAEALDEIPAQLAALIDNCVILVEDFPPPDLPDTLGLYSGIPLTERGEFYTGLPDHISIFRYPYTRSPITSGSTMIDYTSSATTDTSSAQFVLTSRR
jgi:predicted Zn-dependent protease with MMP-like domain